jgi:hypothetical protein
MESDKKAMWTFLLEKGWNILKMAARKQTEAIVSRRERNSTKETLRRRITVTSSINEYPWISLEIGWLWGAVLCRLPPLSVAGFLKDR